MTRICSGILCLLLVAAQARAAETFSKEQLQELARILAKHEECIRADSKSEAASSSTNTRSDCASAAIAAVTQTPALDGVDAAPNSPFAKGMVTPAAEAITPNSAFFIGTGHAPSDRDSGKGEPKFDITATSESSKVSINVSHTVSAALRNTGGQGVGGTFSSFSATLSAPVGKSDSGKTNIATLDGFANASTLTLGYHQFFIAGLKTPGIGELSLADIEKACKDAGIDIDKDPCDSKAIKQRAAAGSVTLDPKVAAFFFDRDAFKWAYGATATVGHDSYDFFDPKTLANNTDIKVPWSVGAYTGFIPKASNSFLSAGIQFQRAYMARKSKVECPAFSGTPPFPCVSGSIGAPTRTDKRLVYLEDRTDLGPAAVDLRVTHDFASGDNGVDVPIYLFKDAKSTWTGGVRMGWTNTDHFDVGVFVGSSFGVFP